MKKFLFTLATLLMAGSMFAGQDNYFYMDNITLTKEEAAAGCKKVVDVKAHFADAVSAWEANFTLPEGVTIDMAVAGSDMTITYQNQFVDQQTLDPYYAEAEYTPNLSPNADKTKFIVSVMDTKEFDPETGRSYGICYRPGDYNQMWRVRLVFPAGFKGGDIVLNSQPACGRGVMPGLTPCDLDGFISVDKTTEVRIKADTPVIEVTGDDYSKTVTISAEEGATIYYSTDGVNYQVYNDPIVFDEEGTYKVYAYAEGPGEGVERKSKSDVAVSDEFTILAQPVALTVTLDPDEDSAITGQEIAVAVEANKEGATFSYAVEPATGATVTATEDGFKINATEAGTYKVTVTATVGEETATAEGTYTFVAPLAVTLNPDEANAITGEKIAVAVEANKEGATFSYACEGATVTATDDGFEITATAAGTYTVTVTATVGEETATATGTYTFAVPLAVTLNPDEANAITGEKIAVAVEANKEGATFSYACEGATVTATDDGFEITATAAGTYTVTVTATVGDETATATGTYTFVEPLAVTLDPATGNAKVGQEIAVTVEANKEGATFNYACEGATVTETEDGFKITATAAGTYTVTVTATVGEETATAEGTYTFSAITYAPEPTITLIDDNTKVQATAPEGYNAVLMLEGTACANPYILPEASTEQETVLNFSAYTEKKTEDNNSETVPYTVTIAIKPTITFTPVENGVKVNILNFTEYTIKVNGTTVDSRAGTGELVVEKGDAEKVIDVYAKNAPEGRVPAEATDQYTLAAKKVYEVKDPTIDVTNDAANQTTIITITPNEGNLLYTLTGEDGQPFTDYTVEVVDGKTVITIPNGNETQFVTVAATTTLTTVPEGYDEVEDGEAEKIVEVPKYQQTAAPTIDVSFGGDTGNHYANVTFVNNDDASAVIEYSLDGGQTWITYTGAPVVITTYGENTVLARATATGKATSEVTERAFTLDDDATSVNELTNGKTVAGVRYFNMAGQEMQEANGITIVVTTYTDGTTSAVKVIK